MRRKFFISFTFIFLFSLTTFGQKENRIWYFGGDPSFPTVPGAGLDFNSGSPAPLTNSAMGYTEGSAVQADRNGNLLFYTNGMKVWDRTHAVMMNGNGLGGHTSSEQSAVIIPFPSYVDTSKFYLFANDGFPTAPGTGLYYSIIDMSLNGGLGAVTATKAVPLLGATSEWLSASQHSNGEDFWVVTADFDSAIFYSYQITSYGISAPVITNLGYNSQAYFKLDFNNKGNKIAFKAYHNSTSQYSRIIADFNQITGVISNPIPLDTTVISNDGAGFSPNDSLFYCFYNMGAPSYDLLLQQYNLAATNILASKQTIMQFDTYPHLDMKNGPDGKLYVSNATTDSIDVINSPNIPGPGCDFQKNAIYLNGKKYRFLFPNRIFEIAKSTSSLSVNDISTNSFNIFPNPSHGDFQISRTSDQTKFFIYNSIGQVVCNMNFLKESQSQVISLNLDRGIYFIQVYTDKGSFSSKKIIIE
jgi:hypothetical protein